MKKYAKLIISNTSIFKPSTWEYQVSKPYTILQSYYQTWENKRRRYYNVFAR